MLRLDDIPKLTREAGSPTRPTRSPASEPSWTRSAELDTAVGIRDTRAMIIPITEIEPKRSLTDAANAVATVLAAIWAVCAAIAGIAWIIQGFTATSWMVVGTGAFVVGLHAFAGRLRTDPVNYVHAPFLPLAAILIVFGWLVGVPMVAAHRARKRVLRWWRGRVGKWELFPPAERIRVVGPLMESDGCPDAMQVPVVIGAIMLVVPCFDPATDSWITIAGPIVIATWAAWLVLSHVLLPMVTARDPIWFVHGPAWVVWLPLVGLARVAAWFTGRALRFRQRWVSNARNPVPRARVHR